MSLAVSRRTWDNAPETIRGSAFTLLLALADYADERNLCWPTLGTLARKAHVKERQATDLLRELETTGQVVIARKPGRDGGMLFAVLTGLSPAQKAQTLHLFETEKVQFLTRKGAISCKEKVQFLHEPETPFAALQPAETPLAPQCNDHKNDHERSERAAPPAEATIAIGQSNGEPDQQQPVRPARTPTPPVSAAPPSPPPPAIQPRLVETLDADPVAIYREAAGVKKPNAEQRRAIAAHITGHADVWREVCERFARNAWNVRRVDNLLDAYDKAVAERKRAAARAAEEEQARRDREPIVISEEQRQRNIAKLAEARKHLSLFQPGDARRAVGRSA